MTIRTSPRFWVFGLILSIYILKMTSVGWGGPISFNEYKGRIQTAIEYLESGEGTLQGDDTSYLRELFPPGLMVQNGRGEKIRTDRQGLLQWAQEKDKRPGGRNALITQLKSLQNQLSWVETRETAIGKPGWAEKRRLLDKVYEAGEFKHLKEQQKPRWRIYLEERLKALGDWLRKQLGPLGPVLPGGWIEYPLYGFIIILGGVLIVWIFRSVGPIGWRWRQTKTRRTPKQDKPPEKDWLTWRGQALSKAERGAFREAIRSLFVSVLMEGHQRGWWIYEPESTNREHLARLEGPVERRRALKKLTDLYEESWYGLGRPGREEFRKCQEWLQQIGSAHQG